MLEVLVNFAKAVWRNDVVQLIVGFYVGILAMIPVVYLVIKLIDYAVAL